MNPNTPANSDDPQLGKQSTPEEDIALQAIEALDTEASPTSDSAEPSPNSSSSAPPLVSNPIEDIKNAPAEPAPELDTPTSSENTTPAPASALSQSLDDAPSSTNFQPFAAQKKSRKPLLIALVVILALAIIGVGGYFGWQYYQSTLDSTNSENAQTTDNDNTEGVAEETDAIDESSASQVADDIESTLDSLSDEELNDDTLSEDSLYN